VIITQNQLLDQTNTKTLHNVQLEFTNPSLLMLNAGETEFVVALDGKILGNGVLEPFILPPMSKAVVDGKYLSDNINVDYDEKSQVVEISGMTKYDVFFTSIDVPFSYYPTESQAREFIQQN